MPGSLRRLRTTPRKDAREARNLPTSAAERRRECVKRLLAGELVDEAELGYDLDAEHVGLMAAGQVDHPAMARGIAYLKRTQEADGLWSQAHYTGGGFPRVFYLNYHGYPKFFPLWALARYRNLKVGNSRRVEVGL